MAASRNATNGRTATAAPIHFRGTVTTTITAGPPSPRPSLQQRAHALLRSGRRMRDLFRTRRQRRQIRTSEQLHEILATLTPQGVLGGNRSCQQNRRETTITVSSDVATEEELASLSRPTSYVLFAVESTSSASEGEQSRQPAQRQPNQNVPEPGPAPATSTSEEPVNGAPPPRVPPRRRPPQPANGSGLPSSPAPSSSRHLEVPRSSFQRNNMLSTASSSSTHIDEEPMDVIAEEDESADPSPQPIASSSESFSAEPTPNSDEDDRQGEIVVRMRLSIEQPLRTMDWREGDARSWSLSRLARRFSGGSRGVG